jgi:hypothetical protein
MRETCLWAKRYSTIKQSGGFWKWLYHKDQWEGEMNCWACFDAFYLNRLFGWETIVQEITWSE